MNIEVELNYRLLVIQYKSSAQHLQHSWAPDEIFVRGGRGGGASQKNPLHGENGEKVACRQYGKPLGSVMVFLTRRGVERSRRQVAFLTRPLNLR